MSDLLPETLWVFAKEHTDRDGYPSTLRGWEYDSTHNNWYEERGMPLKKYRRADLPRPQDAARIAELEAENARLREALHQVRNIQTPTVIPWTHETAADTYWKMIDHLKWVARAALAADSGAAE